MTTPSPLPAFDRITPEETFAAQDDLASLCAPRDLRTSEIFQPNAYYGHDQIIKHYAGFSAEYSLKVAIPHGVAGLDEMPSFGRRELVPVAVWTHEERRDFEVRTGVTARLWPMAVPYLYLLALQHDVRMPAREGTVFFPIHSTTGHRVVADFAAQADQLRSLPAERHPVTVCMYFQDILHNHHEPFLDRGLRIVTAGHGLDPLFLVRFHHLCSAHRWASGTDLGTHAFYAIRSGCSYFHLEAGEARWDVPGRSNTDPVYLKVKDELLAISDLPADQQRVWADKYLGARFFRSPEELRRMLRRAELLDKVGFDLVGRGLDRRLVLPSAWRRSARSILKVSSRLVTR